MTNLALVGAGGIARAHMAAAKSLAGLVGFACVIEPVPEARKAVEEQLGVKGFASASDAIKAGVTPAGWLVCTPPAVRKAVFGEIVSTGKPVLFEKPLAHTAEDAKWLAENAKAKNIKAFVGYCHRFTPAVIDMKKRIAAGDIGNVLRFENTFACDLPHLKDKWMSDAKVSGGGALMDMGCHSLDLLRFVVGEASVMAGSFVNKWPGRSETAATVLLKLARGDGGGVGVIHAGWSEAARFDVAVVGDGGTLAYDYDKPKELLKIALDGKRETIAVEPHDLRFERQLRAFAAVCSGESSGDMSTFADGLKAAELVAAAYQKA